MKILLWCLPFFLLILLVVIPHPPANEEFNKAECTNTTVVHSCSRWSEIPLHSSIRTITMQWLRGMDKGARSTSGKEDTISGIPLSPNISLCHSSPSEPVPPFAQYHEVNCCPETHSGPIIDFKIPSPSSPIRIRRPAHLVDKEYLAKYYEKAVSMMKRLGPDHPHNFWRQANIHCIYCNGAYDQANFDGTRFKTHRSWLFFPFHRFYLYFHERILGKLIGDDRFALPYWNWDTPDGMVIPNIYSKGSLYDQARQDTHLPPTVADVSWDCVEKGLEPADQIASNLTLMYHHMVSGARKSELFMGCKLRSGADGACDGPGTIELAPHNSLHGWVGNASNPEGEDMGAFYAASRDPIFYVHHSNIDRMWEVWKSLHKNDMPGREFDEPEWLNSEFYFYDENLNLVRVKVRDCLDIDKLRYRYEEVDLPWLDARPKPSVAPTVARGMLIMHKNVEEELGNQGPWTLEQTIRTRIRRPTTQWNADEEEVLVVHGINVQTDTYVKFDVYINVLDETTSSPASREYAGCYVKNKGELAMNTKTTIKLGISEILEDLEADKDDSICVLLVPRGGTGNTTRVDGIRIEYMQ